MKKTMKNTLSLISIVNAREADVLNNTKKWIDDETDDDDRADYDNDDDHEKKKMSDVRLLQIDESDDVLSKTRYRTKREEL